MRIGFTSVFVKDQAAALRFYTEVLGFEKKSDVPMGEYRWLTVIAPGGGGGAELVLEPGAHPAAKAFQEAIHGDGIPANLFVTDDIHGDHERLTGRGVVFKTPPTKAGDVTLAVFDDTCGNWIQLVEE